MSATQVLIDGDPIVYRIGFASQSRNLHCIFENEESGEIQQVKFPSKTDRNNWVKDHSGWVLVDEQEEIIPEPIENALSGTKHLLRDIMDESESEDIHVILSESSGKLNFRHTIAKQAPYKGNRKLPRPVHYQNIREYLVNHWGAQIVTTREADDELSIRAKVYRGKGIPYVIASIDKDLDQIPGQHYDYAKKVSYNVSEDEARRAFWIQVLAGDPTDNIPGAWRIGQDRAPKLVDQWIASGADDAEVFQLVVNTYEASKKFSTCPYRDTASIDVATETAQLVWMQDTPCVLWMPPGVERKRIACESDD